MFPSTTNGSHDPISYSDQQGYNRLFFNDITPNSKQEEPPLSFFHLPSPFVPFELDLEDNVLVQQSLDPFLQQQPLRAITSSTSVSHQSAVTLMDSNKNGIMELTEICHKRPPDCTSTNPQPTPRKRLSCKRDRHSKINTAQGPRDRRMRLSLKVAREFFDLQDKLGFDKASKTVEWLLIQSRHEIKKLCSSLPKMMNYSCSIIGGTKSASSTSECEVVSGIDEISIEAGSSTLVGTKVKPTKCARKEKKPRPSRNSAFHTQAKESREKARARARERTREKLWSRRISNESKPAAGEEAASHEMNHINGCSPFETGEESGTYQSHNINPSMEVPTEVEAPTSNLEQDRLDAPEDIIVESLVTSKWSPTYFNHFHNIGIPEEEVSSTENFSSSSILITGLATEDPISSTSTKNIWMH
ncbi:hypothetical protein Tsubulata_045856 [Turnera subulata]|uniref:TCP domain-containing protein n=1 Tax=Turnera subulata TaxID=218843 RepID=A0A9Q0FZ18_9ROSI|nr:hypothetical protein Tsubulata_045856 [Turnera subulata]